MVIETMRGNEISPREISVLGREGADNRIQSNKRMKGIK
jgi:hypothetical protein